MHGLPDANVDQKTKALTAAYESIKQMVRLLYGLANDDEAAEMSSKGEQYKSLVPHLPVNLFLRMGDDMALFTHKDKETSEEKEVPMRFAVIGKERTGQRGFKRERSCLSDSAQPDEVNMHNVYSAMR